MSLKQPDLQQVPAETLNVGVGGVSPINNTQCCWRTKENDVALMELRQDRTLPLCTSNAWGETPMEKELARTKLLLAKVLASNEELSNQLARVSIPEPLALLILHTITKALWRAVHSTSLGIFFSL